MRTSAKERRDMLIAQRRKKEEQGRTVKPYTSKYFGQEHKEFFKDWLFTPNPDGKYKLLKAGTGCVDKDTEYFNGSSWVKIGDFEKGDKVLQYNMDGTSSLVEPLEYHKYECDFLSHIESKYGLDQMLSDEHNMILEHRGKIIKQSFKKYEEKHNSLKKGNYDKFLTTFNFEGEKEIELTDDELRLQIAVMADGHFQKETSESVVIRLKKVRKQKRLEELLKETKTEWHLNKNSIKGFKTYSFKPKLKIKNPPKSWYKLSTRQARIIFEESQIWDGYKDGKVVVTTINKEEADFFQFITTICGFRSTISTDDYERKGDACKKRNVCYSVHYTKRTKITFVNSTKRNEIRKVKTLDGFKYCFSVPSSMLVLRRNDKIFITGNSGKTYITVTELANRGEKVIFCTPNIATSLELAESDDYDAKACYGDYNLLKSAVNDDLGNGYVIFMTYKQLNNLIKKKVRSVYKDFYLVIDECHCLTINHGINASSISAIIKMEAEGGYFKDMLFISATELPTIFAIGRENLDILEFRKKNNELRYHINNMIIPEKASLIGSANQVIQKLKGKILVLSPTDKMMNQILGENNDATVINADNKRKCKVFESIVKNKVIPKDAPKITIMTDLLSAGLNLMNTDISNVVIVGTTDQTLIRQFPARLRKVDKVNVFIISKFEGGLQEEITREEMVLEAEESVTRLNGLNGTNEKFNKRLEYENNVISYVEKTLDENFTIFEINEHSIGANLWQQYSRDHILQTDLFYPDGESISKNYMLEADQDGKELAELMKQAKEEKKLKAEIEEDEIYEIVNLCAAWIGDDGAFDEIKSIRPELTENQLKVLEEIVRKVRRYPELNSEEVAKMVISSDYESEIRYSVYREHLHKAPTRINKILKQVMKLQPYEEVTFKHDVFEGIESSTDKKTILQAVWDVAQISDRPFKVKIVGKKPTLNERGFTVKEIQKLEQLYVKKIRTKVEEA